MAAKPRNVSSRRSKSTKKTGTAQPAPSAAKAAKTKATVKSKAATRAKGAAKTKAGAKDLKLSGGAACPDIDSVRERMYEALAGGHNTEKTAVTRGEFLDLLLGSYAPRLGKVCEFEVLMHFENVFDHSPGKIVITRGKKAYLPTTV